jgi:hypothetical protein
MIISLPVVDDDGREYGGELSFKFKDLTAIKRMDKWEYIQAEPDRPRVETRKLVEGCCTLLFGREEFDVKANYDEMVAKFKEYNEMFA